MTTSSKPKAARRSEQEIFSDLAALCKSSGYVHLIAYVCFRENLVGIGDELTAKDLSHFSSPERLIRTEISTLIGLMIQGDITWDKPSADVFQAYATRTYALLHELHETIAAAGFAYLDPAKAIDPSYDPLSHGEVLREAIFYGGESAFISQYRDFAARKYRNDNTWLQTTKGFSIETATEVVAAVGRLQSKNIVATLDGMRSAHPDTCTFLPGFAFKPSEVAAESKVDPAEVDAVLRAFTTPEKERNPEFTSLTDFNVSNALPVLQAPNGEFIAFQTYGLVEALYESPFYWMVGDAGYRSTAMQNRGDFTESFCSERLELVFGKDRVFQNVDLFDGKDKLGEIDVLVIFGNRAIVLQGKAKRLTLDARRGNDLQLRDDFKKSVQDAYDQGLTCAKRLCDSIVRLEARDGRVVAVPPLRETYILCVVSDRYPALTVQARQFLKYEASDPIQPPLVADVFLVDVLTEMLRSPLHFLSYVNRRVNYNERLMAQELTILSYHLKTNLWLKDEEQIVVLHDDIAADLDVAMAVRREGLKGKATPDGILTRLESTAIGRLLHEIEGNPNPGVIDLGFLLLTLSEDAVMGLSNTINKLRDAAKKDGSAHDVTVTLAGTGLTIHINDRPLEEAAPKLQGHCELRKYTQKANRWYGICLSAATGALRFGVNSTRKWEYDAEMDKVTSGMRAPGKLEELVADIVKKKKVGRNDPCPCGSGRKFKKCHGAN